MSVHKATTGALAFSGATVLICMASLILIYRDVQSIWNELDVEMDSFKVLSDDLWNDMLKLGAGTPANRVRRQYGGYGASGSNTGGGPVLPTATLASNPLNVGVPSAHGSSCQCKSGDDLLKCPEGPAGAPGEAGIAGLDGLPGLNGIPGKDAEDIHNEPPRGCFNCPAGKILYL